MLSKLAAQESHGAPPGLYLLLFWITSGRARRSRSWRRLRSGRRGGSPARNISWRGWSRPGLFELVLTKLPHYVLPLYPAIAILTSARWSGACCRAPG